MLILAVGQRMPAWVDTAVAEYTKRMPADFSVELRELKSQSRSGTSTETILALEAERIRQALPKRATTIVLDEKGQDVSSQALASHLLNWRGRGDPIAFIIGSADGLDVSLKQSATMLMRLSSMTLPHGLARVLLAEQLYRAWSIIDGHPYHRV